MLALDFDGVLFDSIREVLAVATQTYLRLEPDATLVRELAQRGEDDPHFLAFRSLVPFGNRAEDFGVALSALQRRLILDDQESYDHLYESFDPSWLDRYHRIFYRCRRELRNASPKRWLGLHRPYTSFIDVLDRHQRNCHFAIVTAKDRESVHKLLVHFQLQSMFPAELILDKEVGIHKTAHLQALAVQLGLPIRGMRFVDDKLNHLERAASLGVRPVLAAWGYNSAREHRLARDRGFDVATLTNAEEILFPT